MFKFRIVSNMVSDDAMILARKVFFKLEPMNRNLKLAEDPEGLKDIENYTQQILRNGVCVRAETRDENKLVGFLVSAFSGEDKKIQFKSEKMMKIKKLLEELEVKSDWQKLYPQHKNNLELKIGTIEPAYQSQNIASTMINIKRLWAVENGFDLALVKITSGKLRKNLLAMNFRELASIEYKTYMQDGKRVFTDMEEKAIAIFAFDCKEHRENIEKNQK